MSHLQSQKGETDILENNKMIVFLIKIQNNKFMRTITHFLFLLQTIILFGQELTISGPGFICINTYGTASVDGDLTYDTYQWYSKFSYDEEAVFEPIEGANSSSFSYNIEMNEYTIKLVATLNNETFHSNEIILEAPWTTGVLMSSSNDDPNYFYSQETGHNICAGYSMRMEILSLWSYNVKWIRDDVLIEGATRPVYFATESGNYAALCAHEICPQDFSYSLGLSLQVNQCNLSTSDVINKENDLKVYSNSSVDQMFLYQFDAFKISHIEVYDLSGKMIKSQVLTENNSPIYTNGIKQGIYILRVFGGGKSTNIKFIKK